MQHVSASHHSGASSSLDAYDFDDASAATQEIVDACKRRNCHNRVKQRSSQRVATSCTDPFRFADVLSQDPAAFAHLLADHFVAREASNAAVAASAKPQQLARPVAGSVGLGSFRSWQFGERCLATYRVLFGRPLWAAPASPRPRKRKHVTPPTSSSSDSSDDVDHMTVGTPTDETFALEDKMDTALEEDVLAGLAGLGTDADTGGDSIDLLWELDDVDGGVMLPEGEEAELRFLATSPFAPVSPAGENMEDV
ncbi:hypothetical protein GQ600_16113 [Phytophthora cactorum]|nr:hypothetical protein GQ600_16113 [Phytophthora cactorum]